MSETDTITRRLMHTLDGDRTLASRLEQSLVKACELAEANLDPRQFAALEWPTDRGQYEAYLQRFIRWVPQESDLIKISDRLSRFYWLIDQTADDDEEALAQGSDVFKDWLTEFSRQWGSFLDTTESFNPEILQSFLELPEYRMGDSMVDGAPNMPSGWLTFNQFFARHVNGGLRPIAEPDNNLVISSPADCRLEHVYDIDADSNIPATTLKGTHTYGNIRQLLEGSQYAESFAGGTFLHYVLQPFDYHRLHLPVGGRVKESFVTQGKVVQRIDLEDHQLTVKDSALTGYQFWQTRGVVTIDTTDCEAGNIGIVAIVPVGMWQVASVVLTAVKGKRMAKGEEFGYFQFGGSETIVVLQQGVDVQVEPDDGHRLVGSVAAHCNPRGS